MSLEYFKLDTRQMCAEHRSEMLEKISQSNGCWILTSEEFVFKLMWDKQKDDFNILIPHSQECSLTPWGIY